MGHPHRHTHTDTQTHTHTHTHTGEGPVDHPPTKALPLQCNLDLLNGGAVAVDVVGTKGAWVEQMLVCFVVLCLEKEKGKWSHLCVCVCVCVCVCLCVSVCVCGLTQHPAVCSVVDKRMLCRTGAHGTHAPQGRDAKAFGAVDPLDRCNCSSDNNNEVVCVCVCVCVSFFFSSSSSFFFFCLVLVCTFAVVIDGGDGDC